MQADLVEQIVDISWVDLKSQYLAKKSEILAMVDRVFTGAEFVNGKSVDLLESEIAQYVGVKHVACLNSGTDALVFSMRGLGIGSGDEVITPPNSFVASTSSVVHTGATPIFVDVKEDQNIDPALIEAAITPRTKAIIVVHLAGRPADMDAINEIAKRHGLFVIEDSAQAFGAKYAGVMCGALGDVGCFSAHPLKIFNAAGDAGFITTNNTDLFNKIKLMRNHGLIDRTTAVEWGYVSRMNALQAELLRMRLAEEFSENLNARQINASLYKNLLNSKFVFIPPVSAKAFHTYMCLVIQVPRRDELQKHLLDLGVKVAIHYPVPIHMQPVAQYLGYKEGDFPMTEKQAKSIMTIPVHQYLKRHEIEYVANAINDFYE